MAGKNQSYKREHAEAGRRTCIIGIDPGLTGAVAVYDAANKQLITAWDIPTIRTQVGRSSFNNIDIQKLAQYFAEAVTEYYPAAIALEDVHSSPQMGVASAFSFGEGFGIVKTIAALYGPQIHYLSPARWKTAMVGRGKDKDASVEIAKKRFGNSPYLTLKKHHGRAEAALMALFLAEQMAFETRIAVNDVDPLS